MLWWISWADDRRCLGVAVVEAETARAALRLTRKIAPSAPAERMVAPVLPEDRDAAIGRLPRGRLLNPEALERAGVPVAPIGAAVSEERLEEFEEWHREQGGIFDKGEEH